MKTTRFTEVGVAPLDRTHYCSVKGVKNESKKRSVRARISSTNAGIGQSRPQPSELAKEFGCHDTSISAWVRQANADELAGGRPDAPLTTAERQELAQLRRQLREVTQEHDILAKATAWFANKDSGIDKTSMR